MPKLVNKINNTKFIGILVSFIAAFATGLLLVLVSLACFDIGIGLGFESGLSGSFDSGAFSGGIVVLPPKFCSWLSTTNVYNTFPLLIW